MRPSQPPRGSMSMKAKGPPSSSRRNLPPSFQYPKTLPFLTNEIFGGNFQIVEKHLIGFVIDHIGDRRHR
ncbi:MAG: hypothetical protein J0H57_07905, partial [Rhodospirillales bacterium]|nr:hypothetical protein [Rhodospirillales bacterium]